MEVKDLEGLKSVFANNVIPLLEEYFYGDFGKIGLILGGAFVKEKAREGIHFASNFEYADKDILSDRTLFEFTPQSDWTTESFTSIYTK